MPIASICTKSKLPVSEQQQQQQKKKSSHATSKIHKKRSKVDEKERRNNNKKSNRRRKKMRGGGKARADVNQTIFFFTFHVSRHRCAEGRKGVTMLELRIVRSELLYTVRVNSQLRQCRGLNQNANSPYQ